MKWWSGILDWLGMGPAVDTAVLTLPAEREPELPFDGTARPDADPPEHTEEGDAASEQHWWQPPGHTVTEAPRLSLGNVAQAQKLTEEFRSFVDRPEIELPHLPKVAQGVLTALRQPNINFSGVAKLISKDQTLSATSLRLANSAAFAPATEITNLEVALSRLGMKTIRNLMIKESVKAVTLINTATGDTTAEKLWHKSMASAVIMENLAALYDIKSDEAFLLGLLHDIGEVVILRLAYAYKQARSQTIPDATFDYICQECHEQVGHALAEYWHLPSAIRPVIKDHHGPVNPNDRYAVKKCLVQVSDILASLMGYGSQDGWDLLSALPARQIGFGAERIHRDVLEYLPDLVRVELSLAF